MSRVFRVLMRLYPRGYREAFGAEMLSVLQQAVEERARRGGRAGFVIREIWGMVSGAAREWLVAAPAGCAVPDEVAAARKRVDEAIAGMTLAIASHQFEKTREFCVVEREAREHLALVMRQHGLG